MGFVDGKPSLIREREKAQRDVVFRHDIIGFHWLPVVSIVFHGGLRTPNF